MRRDIDDRAFVRAELAARVGEHAVAERDIGLEVGPCEHPAIAGDHGAIRVAVARRRVARVPLDDVRRGQPPALGEPRLARARLRDIDPAALAAEHPRAVRAHRLGREHRGREAGLVQIADRERHRGGFVEREARRGARRVAREQLAAGGDQRAVIADHHVDLAAAVAIDPQPVDHLGELYDLPARHRDLAGRFQRRHRGGGHAPGRREPFDMPARRGRRIGRGHRGHRGTTSQQPRNARLVNGGRRHAEIDRRRDRRHRREADGRGCGRYGRRRLRIAATQEKRGRTQYKWANMNRHCTAR